MHSFRTYYSGHSIEVSVGETLANQIKTAFVGMTFFAHPLRAVATGAGIKCHTQLSIDGRRVDERDISAVAGGDVTLQGCASDGTFFTASVKVAAFKYYCSIYAGGRLILQDSRWHG
jgi:hypothetical protein